MANSQASFGINRWVSELGLSGDEARVFDVLYRKCYRSPYNIHSRQEFYYTHCYEFYGISRRTFMRYLQKYQKCALIVLNKCNEGLFLSTSVTSSPCTPIYIKNKKDKKSSCCFPDGSAEPGKKTTTKTTEVFSIPSFEDVYAYAKERHATKALAKKFFQYYSGNGWMVGRNRMANWKAVFALWADKEAPLAKAENPGAQPLLYTPDPEEKAREIAEEERLNRDRNDPDFQHLVDQICHRYTGK